MRYYTEKMYLCKLIMRKLVNILLFAIALISLSCSDKGGYGASNSEVEVVASVDSEQLTLSDIRRDIPVGLTGADSVTFVRMYIDSWVLKQLKISRAEQVLSSYEEDIEQLVEGYRQSLIMRQLDQYYIDRAIDTDVTERQITAHYRANAAIFKLDHHEVKGVVVKTPRNFRNTSTLSTALRNVAKVGDAQEVAALAEKHSLVLTDMSTAWTPYSDFLSHLPTVRTRSYDGLLADDGVQQMSSDDAVFYFIITDVVRKGETAPIECVEEDIRRMLYAERRADIVNRYEEELRREAVGAGRVMVADTVLMQSMSYTADEPRVEEVYVREVESDIENIEDTDSLVME